MPHKDPERLKAWRTEHYARNRERLLAYQKEYRAGHRALLRHKSALRRQSMRETIARQQREAYHGLPADQKRQRNQKARLRSYYGISVEQYELMLHAQHGVCAICKGRCDTGQRLSVDHDHNNGRNRGLLCRRCNSLIGYAKENPRILKAAIAYLRAWQSVGLTSSAA